MKKIILLPAAILCLSAAAQFKIDLSGNFLYPGKAMIDSPVYQYKGSQLGLGLSYRFNKLEVGAEVVYQVLNSNFENEMKKQGFYSSGMTISTEKTKQVIIGAKGKWKTFKGGGIKLHAGMITAGNYHSSKLKDGTSGVYNTFYYQNEHPGFVIQPGLFYDIDLTKQVTLGINAGYSFSGTKYTVYTEPYTPPSIPPGPPKAFTYKQQFFQLGISIGYNFKGKKDSSTRHGTLLVPTTRSFAITGFPGHETSTSSNTISKAQVEKWLKEFVEKAGDTYKELKLENFDDAWYLSLSAVQKETGNDITAFIQVEEKAGDILFAMIGKGAETVAICFGTRSCSPCKPTRAHNSCYCTEHPNFQNVCSSLAAYKGYEGLKDLLLQKAISVNTPVRVTGFNPVNSGNNNNKQKSVSKKNLQQWIGNFVSAQGDVLKDIYTGTSGKASFLGVTIEESTTKKTMTAFIELAEMDGNLYLRNGPKGPPNLCMSSPGCNPCQPKGEVGSLGGCYCPERGTICDYFSKAVYADLKDHLIEMATARSFAITGFSGNGTTASSNTISKAQLEKWSKEFITKAGDEFRSLSLDTAENAWYLSIDMNESGTNKLMTMFLPLEERDGDIVLMPMPGGGTQLALCFGARGCDHCRPTKNFKTCYCIANPKFVDVCQEMMVGPVKYEKFRDFLLKKADGH